MFNEQQIKFMRSLGLNFDFEHLSVDDYVRIEEVVGEKLQKSGFNENYDITAVGKLCESILDRLG